MGDREGERERGRDREWGRESMIRELEYRTFLVFDRRLIMTTTYDNPAQEHYVDSTLVCCVLQLFRSLREIKL